MILREYVKGDIRANKKNYMSSIISIFLAVLILASFSLGIYSYYSNYRQLLKDESGGYHFRLIEPIPREDIIDLGENRHIDRLGLLSIEEVDQAFGIKNKAIVFKMDDNSMSTIKSWVKQGSLPKKNELMISSNMAAEENKEIGDSLALNGREYKISAIYYETSYKHEDFYHICLNLGQDELLKESESLTAFIWYKNIFRTYEISNQILENFPQGTTYNYNKFYLDKSFVFDPDLDLFKDYSFQLILILLFIILGLLFYFIIKNLFLVQESKSIVEYSRLKAIGASNRDIKKISLLKALYISQLPIVLAIISATGLIKVLSLIINKVDLALGQGDAYSLAKNLRLKINPLLVLGLYLISLAIILLASKKPIKKLKKLSIVKGLKADLSKSSPKKYDLDYKGDIERDLARHFYRNSRRNFRFSKLTLRLGFILLTFIVSLLSYHSLDTNYNHSDIYRSYDLNAQYASLESLDQSMLDEVSKLPIEELVRFRHEGVFLDLKEEDIDRGFIEAGSLNLIKEKNPYLSQLHLEIFGIEDQAFQEPLRKQDIDPEGFKGPRVLLLNTMADNIQQPLSKIKDSKFLRDDIKSLDLSEYGELLDTRGYEFQLDVSQKVYQAPFDYEFKKDRLNVFMPLSEYKLLLDNFEKIADLDQFEYLALRTDQVEEVAEGLDSLSLGYFRNNDFKINSRIDFEKDLRKKNILGSVMAIFFSIFFILVAFSNSYFSFYNLFLEREEDFLLYRSLGMDSQLLSGILGRERRKILLSFTLSLPILLLLIAFLTASLTDVFTGLDILSEMNYYIILGYILIILLAISKMYNKYRKNYIGK